METDTFFAVIYLTPASSKLPNTAADLENPSNCQAT